MKIKVRFEQGNENRIVEFKKTTVKELLIQLNVNPETVLVARNKEIITSDETLQDDEIIDLLSVISGG
ncbi:thiamine biosynthesis protein ThiS [archaeon]|nr:thiamine biosynthesis protein ThiS [archaeon]